MREDLRTVLSLLVSVANWPGCQRRSQGLSCRRPARSAARFHVGRRTLAALGSVISIVPRCKPCYPKVFGR